MAAVGREGREMHRMGCPLLLLLLAPLRLLLVPLPALLLLVEALLVQVDTGEAA